VEQDADRVVPPWLGLPMLAWLCQMPASLVPIASVNVPGVLPGMAV